MILVNNLPGAPDKWLALFILIHTGRFADEHQLRVRISDAEDGLCSRAGQMRALCATAHAFANRRQQFCFVWCGERLRPALL
jgi:hypothetical protein